MGNVCINVTFLCDNDEDHTVPIADCCTSRTKTFDNQIDAINFINECTYVYNLDTLLAEIKGIKVNKNADIIETSKTSKI